MGIPAQLEVVHEVFRLTPESIERAVVLVHAFQQAEAEGRGAVMLEGQMADRATDRLNRTLLFRALRQGQLDCDRFSFPSDGDF